MLNYMKAKNKKPKRNFLGLLRGASWVLRLGPYIQPLQVPFPFAPIANITKFFGGLQ